MRTLIASTLLIALAVPASAQSTSEVAADTLAEASAAPSAVDPAVVGEWTLNEVADTGFLGRMGAQIRAMHCDFSAEGEATVTMTLFQDEDRIERSRSFEYETEDGQIVSTDDRPVGYRVLSDGRLELSDATGLVILLVRKGT